jgi:hypothetical protein
MQAGVWWDSRQGLQRRSGTTAPQFYRFWRITAVCRAADMHLLLPTAFIIETAFSEKYKIFIEDYRKLKQKLAMV